jgi:hypothetical protein
LKGCGGDEGERRGVKIDTISRRIRGKNEKEDKWMNDSE